MTSLFPITVQCDMTYSSPGCSFLHNRASAWRSISWVFQTHVIRKKSTYGRKMRLCTALHCTATEAAYEMMLQSSSSTSLPFPLNFYSTSFRTSLTIFFLLLLHCFVFHYFLFCSFSSSPFHISLSIASLFLLFKYSGKLRY
jgi:hypothetical protein